MLIYQRFNSTEHDHLQIDVYADFQFLPHLHRDLEFFYVLEGELEVAVQGRSETAGQGDLGLILPNQIHAYRTADHSRVLVCPFSGSFVGAFMREIEGMEGKRTVFPCERELGEYIQYCYIKNEPDGLMIKASLYALCAEYLKRVPLTEARAGNSDLLHRLLYYVEENYRENITVKSAAKEIGYDENYISRYFHQIIGINFRQFVNQHRVEYAFELLEHTDRKISDIALECGFQNIRSFNRAFVALIGKTPTAYQRKHVLVKKCDKMKVE